MNVLNNTYVRSNVHIIADNGRCVMVCPNGKKVADVTIIAYSRSSVNDNTYTMTNVQSITNLGFRRNLDTIFLLCKILNI